MGIGQYLRGRAQLNMAPSQGRSALVASLLKQSMDSQGRGSMSPVETLNIAAKPILAALLSKQEDRARDKQTANDTTMNQALAGALSRSTQGGAQGEAARRAAMIIAGGQPQNPLAQQLLGQQAEQAFAPREPRKTKFVEINEGDKIVTYEVDEATGQRIGGPIATGQRFSDKPLVEINNTDKLPPPPQGMAYVEDKDSPFGFKLAPIPGAKDTRTEAQAKSGLLSTRMDALSQDVIDEAPTITAQMAATFAQRGGIGGGIANQFLDPKQQKHFNAARGWLAGVLRGDTGATIQPFEIQEYYPTFFPVPGDTAEVIAQKKKLRAVTVGAMRANSGQAQGTEDAPFDPTAMSDDELMEAAK